VSQNLGLKCFLLLLRMNNDGLKVSSIEKFKNGAILMYHAHNCLLYYDPSRKEHKYFKVCGSESNFEVAVCIPSFSSIKDAVMGDNVEVLNVKSR
jgi:hypothetical protein